VEAIDGTLNESGQVVVPTDYFDSLDEGTHYIATWTGSELAVPNAPTIRLAADWRPGTDVVLTDGDDCSVRMDLRDLERE
jgi:hypothetical protein